jgi:hypothetical protein
LPQVELMEDGDQFRIQQSEVRKGPHQALAFVDGVRRGEAALYQLDPNSGWWRAAARGFAAASGGRAGTSQTEG